jgi:alkanesulfonate monooxygenase SsuD/methylene tetrahydromethanopterin reductase-like flavin-dependent oxidoreductase (luciferase family)
VKIGITIPNGIPGVDGRTLVEWGVRAEACGFEMAAVIDRVAFPSHEQLVTLAAIASTTKRIRLMTSTMADIISSYRCAHWSVCDSRH